MSVQGAVNIASPPVRASRTLVAATLTKIFGQTVALWRVDAVARSGEVLAVSGPNGSGKSTLLRILAGLTAPTAGSVRTHGEAGLGAQRTAFVGHANHLLGSLTAIENIRLAARLARRTDEPERWLDELGIGASAARPCQELSTGTQRRVALARALITDPDVLLLDEPFSGLDDAAASRVEEVLGRAARDGRLVVLASHDSVRATRLATRSLRLEGGRVVSSEARARAAGVSS